MMLVSSKALSVLLLSSSGVALVSGITADSQPAHY